MEKDAVSAGVAPVGGLFSTAEIKILICYILTEIGEPVPAEPLLNLLHYEGIANAFEVSDAFHALVNSKMILSKTEDQLYYCITAEGKSINETLKDSLPQTVKNRALNAAQKMVTRYKNAKNSIISVEHEENATYVTCTALDRGQPILSIKMLATDDLQIAQIKDHFLENAPEICSKVIDLFTDSAK